MADVEMQPWERQPGESAQAWAAFVAYRDLGHYRSTAKAAQKCSKQSKHGCDVFSRAHNWVARAAAWDAECDRHHRADMLERQRLCVIAHADAAAIVRTHAMAAIDKIQDKMDPDQAIKWLTAAVKIEQTAMGLPSDRTVASVDVKSSNTSDPMQVYFDNLPASQLLSIAREAVKVVESSISTENPHDASSRPSTAGPE